MERVILQQERETLVECDNPKCGYTVPFTGSDKTQLKEYINKPCPKCGENLCTQEDYDDHMKVQRAINWFNKWFSWLTIFMPKSTKATSYEVHTHKGIKITEIKDAEKVLSKEHINNTTKQKIRNYLIFCATRMQLVTYGELASALSLKYDMSIPTDRAEVANLLVEIATEEDKTGRPLITVLIVNQKTMLPGDGFFALAQSLNKLPNTKLTTNDKILFASNERGKCFKYWEQVTETKNTK